MRTRIGGDKAFDKFEIWVIKRLREEAICTKQLNQKCIPLHSDDACKECYNEDIKTKEEILK